MVVTGDHYSFASGPAKTPLRASRMTVSVPSVGRA